MARADHAGGQLISGDGHKHSVLAITSEVPWPLDTGGHLRTFHVMRSLAERFSLRLVAPMPPGHWDTIAELGRYGIVFVPAIVRPRTRWREGIRALSAASRGLPYVFYRRHDRRAVWSALRSAISRDAPDLLYLDHLDSFLYRPALPEVPAVLDLHNVYSILTRRAAREGRSPWSAMYLGHEADLLARIEQRAALETDVLLTVSEEDRRYFAALGAHRVAVVPNGVDCAAFSDMPTGRPAGPPLVLFVGALTWGPNVAAAQILASDIMPEVRRHFPEARARIVGRNPSREVLALGRLPGVEVFGSVPAVGPHLREASLLAVPLEIGGGTRLKILEAFAAGLPVVSTPVGCEGLEVEDGIHLMIADHRRFAEGVISLLRDPVAGERLATRARGLALERYDWARIGGLACTAAEMAIGMSDQ